MVEALLSVRVPPVSARFSWLVRLLMVTAPLRNVVVRTVAPPTLMVTSSAAPGRAGLELQLVTTSQKPSASGTQVTGAASALADNAASMTAANKRAQTEFEWQLGHDEASQVLLILVFDDRSSLRNGVAHVGASLSANSYIAPLINMTAGDAAMREGMVY